MYKFSNSYIIIKGIVFNMYISLINKDHYLIMFVSTAAVGTFKQSFLYNEKRYIRRQN